jgi:hypothetical protein
VGLADRFRRKLREFQVSASREIGSVPGGNPAREESPMYYGIGGIILIIIIVVLLILLL